MFNYIEIRRKWFYEAFTEEGMKGMDTASWEGDIEVYKRIMIEELFFSVGD